MPATVAVAAPPLVPAHADELKCPKCNQPLRRLTGARGSFLLTCPNRQRVEQGRPLDRNALAGRDHCGQKLHVLAAEGIAFVIPISNSQFEQYRKAYPGAAQLYSDLGIIPTRPGVEFVPSFPCLGCTTPTKLYDLRGGYCSECEPKP